MGILHISEYMSYIGGTRRIQSIYGQKDGAGNGTAVDGDIIITYIDIYR